MKNRIHYIFRSLTITCLMAGFLAHLIVPFSSQAQKTAFTRWLDQSVVSTGNESEAQIRNTIKELPEQTGDFWRLVQEASVLVTNHKDQFKLFVTTGDQTKSEHQSTWLIEQWNTFQNQKSGFNSVLIESVKTLSKWIPQNTHFGFIHHESDLGQLSQYKDLFYETICVAAVFSLPLISGISINAP